MRSENPGIAIRRRQDEWIEIIGKYYCQEKDNSRKINQEKID